MPKLNERGAIQFVVLLILILGIIGGVFLVTRGEPLKLLPKATVSGPVGPTTSFALSPNAGSVKVGDEVGVKLVVRSDVVAANLFTAKLNFSKELLAISRIDYSNTLIENWVEQYSDNNTGEISLVGGIPAPGFQTNTSSAASPMAVIYFKALKSGTASISFSADSAIYSNADNINVLTSKEGISIAVGGSGPTPTPTADIGFKIDINSLNITTPLPKGARIHAMNISFTENANFEFITPTDWGINGVGFAPASGGNLAGKTLSVELFTGAATTPKTYSGTIILRNTGNGKQISFPATLTVIPDASPSPSPSATPIPGSGDGNKDGKVNLVDLSVLLTDFNKNQGFRTGIDLNGDGVINTFDFSLMRTLLIQKGIIRG